MTGQKRNHPFSLELPNRPLFDPEAIMNAGLARLRAAQDEERPATKEAAAEAVGELSDREAFAAGVTLYRAEGAKDIIYVAKSADLYRRVEGAWCGIVGGAARRPD